jgi:hypothetical protein
MYTWHFLLGLLEFVEIPAADKDLVVASNKCLGQSQANPGSPTGYEHRMVTQLHRAPSFLSVDTRPLT